MHERFVSICVFVSTLFASTNVFADEPVIAPAPLAAPTSSANAPAADTPPPADVLPEPPPIIPTKQRAKRQKAAPLPPEIPFGPSMWGPGVRPMTVTVKHWYGWQTLAVLVPTDLIVTFMLASGSGGLQLGGALVLAPIHALRGPIVHLAHGRVGAAFASLSVNTALPWASFGIGALFSQLSSHSSAAFYIPIALGFLSAQAIDISFFSYESVKMPVGQQNGARALLPSYVSVVPRIDANFRGFSIVGQF